VRQILIKKGEAVVEEVPAPLVEKDTILVQVTYSCISIGTEMSGVKEGSKSLVRRAIENPDQVAQAARMALEQGIGRTFTTVKGALESGSPTGYSAAGKVIEVGETIHDVQVGDHVACAGAGIANHAEIINVPRNLLVKTPESLNPGEASTVTLGAIALQGIRRANPTLGETFLVIGLGVLGQMTAQMLKANGCRVIGLDPDEARVRMAESLGMDHGLSMNEDPVSRVTQLTDGHGADGVLITASTASDDVVSRAFQSCRKKGRVVLVGDVGLNLQRSDFYVKEIDFLISTSYGPGRYEPNYEKKGLDYPIGYVRWTENRNMQEYIRLLSEGKINIRPLIQDEYKLEDAPLAYNSIKSGEEKPIMVLLKYGQEDVSADLSSKIEVTPSWSKKEGLLHVAVLGSGGFAKGMHLPNLRKLDKQYRVSAIMSRTGSNAKATARQFDAKFATTDLNDILNDDVTDTVLISTRHDLHADMALNSIKSGKHVFVEKPMALNRGELAVLVSTLTGREIPDNTTSIASFIKNISYTPEIHYMVGFNRRFSPYLVRAKELISSRANPMIINYRMNAGYIPLTHWVHSEEGGGRNIGEACHIYDIFNFLTDSEVASIQAQSITPHTEQYAKNDNFVTTIKYMDGSLCNLIYTSLGSKDYPKEEMEIYFDEKIIRMNDYKSLEVYGMNVTPIKLKIADKGHIKELQAFYEAIKKGSEAIPLWQQVQATEISFEVEKKLD
jgi:predicted dehydrogenase/threonine dehydrogenase-like Zn-dependent dehydrogenase